MRRTSTREICTPASAASFCLSLPLLGIAVGGVGGVGGGVGPCLDSCCGGGGARGYGLFRRWGWESMVLGTMLESVAVVEGEANG